MWGLCPEVPQRSGRPARYWRPGVWYSRSGNTCRARAIGVLHHFAAAVGYRRRRTAAARRSFKCVVKWILKIPPHFAYVATLPCETLVLAKQAINDKL